MILPLTIRKEKSKKKYGLNSAVWIIVQHLDPASVLGSIVSSFEAVPNRELYYCKIEQERLEALKTSRG